MTKRVYTEEQKRQALISLIRESALEARYPSIPKNEKGGPVSDIWAGPEFDVVTDDKHLKALVRALTVTDALFVLERMTMEMRTTQ